MALVTLELVLNDFYRSKVKKRGAYRSFADLRTYITQDGLTNDKIPTIKRCGESPLTSLTMRMRVSRQTQLTCYVSVLNAVHQSEHLNTITVPQERSRQIIR